MADTTLAAIIARFQTVCEAASLVKSRDAFSHDRQPNTVLDSAYYVEDGGVQQSRSITSSKAARLERLTVYCARKLKFAPATEVDTLHDLLVTLERAIVADGPANSYHASLVGRRVSRPEGKDFAVGSITILVDYDFSEVAA